MNELTSTGRHLDGRITNGMKGVCYDVWSLAQHWDESMVLTDADLYALVDSAK